MFHNTATNNSWIRVSFVFMNFINLDEKAEGGD